MTKTVRTRHIVTLIAAYTVALQALLLPLSVAAAGPFAAALCITADTGSPQPGHDTGCPCAAGCGTQCCSTQLTAAPAAGDLAAAVSSHVVAPIAALQPAIRASSYSPQLPRAPPPA